ncbi:MAG: hypothetical protein WCA46_18825, partial [Actinocatenispora sp.]
MTETTLRERILRALAGLLGVDPPLDHEGMDPERPAVVIGGPAASLAANAWLRLDSANPFLYFHAGVHVMYTSRATDTTPAQAFEIAKAALHVRADEVSGRFAVTQADRLRAELTVALHERRPTAVDGVDAWASCPEIRVGEQDRTAMHEYENAQRQRQRLEWRYDVVEYQMRQLTPLLTDPERATAWWFAQHPDRSEDLPSIAEGFRAVRDLLRSERTHDPARTASLGPAPAAPRDP